MIPDFTGYWESVCLDAKRECYVDFGQKISAVVSVQESIQNYCNWNYHLNIMRITLIFWWEYNDIVVCFIGSILVCDILSSHIHFGQELCKLSLIFFIKIVTFFWHLFSELLLLLYSFVKFYCIFIMLKELMHSRPIWCSTKSILRRV